MKVTVKNETNVNVMLQEKIGLCWGEKIGQLLPGASIEISKEHLRLPFNYRIGVIVDNVVAMFIETTYLVDSKIITLSYSSTGDFVIA